MPAATPFSGPDARYSQTKRPATYVAGPYMLTSAPTGLRPRAAADKHADAQTDQHRGDGIATNHAGHLAAEVLEVVGGVAVSIAGKLLGALAGLTGHIAAARHPV